MVSLWHVVSFWVDLRDTFDTIDEPAWNGKFHAGSTTTGLLSKDHVMADSEATLAETWRPVVGYENIYEVSSSGNVRRLHDGNRYRALSVLRPTKHRDGYCSVILSDAEHRRSTLRVHRIVLTAFVGCPPSGHECNHKNSVRDDNRVENLEWVTPSQNVLHTYQNGRTPLRGTSNPNARFTEADIRGVRMLCDSKALTYTEIARMFGMTRNNVSLIGRRRAWNHIKPLPVR